MRLAKASDENGRRNDTLGRGRAVLSFILRCFAAAITLCVQGRGVRVARVGAAEAKFSEKAAIASCVCVGQDHRRGGDGVSIVQEGAGRAGRVGAPVEDRLFISLRPCSR